LPLDQIQNLQISLLQEDLEEQKALIDQVLPRRLYQPIRRANMLDKLIAPVTGLLDKFIEDKDEKAKLAHEISTMAEKHGQEIALAQIALNNSRCQR
jgi:hypothetical protein